MERFMSVLKKILNWLFRKALLLIPAVISTVIIGSVISSNRVINILDDIGSKTNFGDRLSMSFYDVTHFGTLYGPFIFLAFTVAFLAAWKIFDVMKVARTLIYVAAGAIAMFVMLWAMEQVFFGVPIVAGARDGFGLILQMLAGGVGGFIFAKLTSLKTAVT